MSTLKQRLQDEFQRGGGLGAVRGVLESARDGEAWMYCALLAHAAGDRAAAAECAAAAHATAPESLLYRHCADHLKAEAAAPGNTAAGQGVYATAAAFTAFCNGGGNVPLYRAVSAALARVHLEAAAAAAVTTPLGSVRVLDIGVGNGLALLPALASEDTAVVSRLRLTLVDPSQQLLAETTSALRSLPATVDSVVPSTFQRFVNEQQQQQQQWDVAEATFSLHNVPPAERKVLFEWLHSHARRVVIAEFNADPTWAVDPLQPACATRVLQLYERGVREYADDPAIEALVARGFLVPMLLGGVTRTPASRTNFEQPISDWVAELLAAGFTDIHVQLLCDYWWAPCYLLTAH